MLTSGELDVMWQIDTESVMVLEKTPRMKVAEVPHGYYCPILMSVAQKPFDDVRVRQAMKYLVNREIFVKTVLQGRGEIYGMTSPLCQKLFLVLICPPTRLILPKPKPCLPKQAILMAFETTLVTTDSFAHAVEGAVVLRHGETSRGND